MSAPEATEVFTFSGFSLDPRKRLLFGPDGRALPLSGRAFDTLLYLVEHPNQLIDKQALMKAVWPNVVVEENNLNQNISIVRRALGETAGEHRFVVTVPGRGFRFVPAVERLDEALATKPNATGASKTSVGLPTPIDAGTAEPANGRAPQSDEPPISGAAARPTDAGPWRAWRWRLSSILISA